MSNIEQPVNKALELMLQMAKEKGMPPDQVDNFVQGGYVLQPKSMEFHALAREADLPDGPSRILCGGARGGSKSHSITAQAGIDDCLREPGLKVLFLRKVQKSAGESLDDLVYRVFGGIEIEYTPSTGEVKFPNGSLMMMGGYKNVSDIEKYLGIEYDVIIIEEVSQLTEDKVQKLLGSLRTSKPNWRPRLYMSTNPGGVGHHWVKENFIIPHREGKEHYWQGGKVAFVPMTWKDNMFLDQGFIDFLHGLGDTPLGKAWRDGDWDVFEGMAFSNFNRDIHVCEPFQIPYEWPRWRAIDWGLTAPFCCLWFAKEPGTGRIYVYRELYRSNLSDIEQAKAILLNTPPEEVIAITWADPALWGRRVHEDTADITPAIYARAGVPLAKADNDRIGGRRKVSRILGPIGDGLPGLVIFDTCRNLIRTLPALPLDENRPEDVDTKSEDHAYDTLKYGLTNTFIKSHVKEPEYDKAKTMADLRML